MRDSFVFHTEHRDILRMLAPEQQLLIYDYLTEFALSDGKATPPKMETAAMIVLHVILTRMRSDFAKYAETLEKRRNGGKNGGRPKKEKPCGSSENLKVSEKPCGFPENLKGDLKPDYVSGFESESDSDSGFGFVCEGDAVREGTRTPSDKEIRDLHDEICRSLGVSPDDRADLNDSLYRFQTHLKDGDDWKKRLAAWISDDVRKGAYSKNSAPALTNRGKTIRKTANVNFEQSGTDWNAVAYEAIEKQEDEIIDKQELEELDFVDMEDLT